MKARWPFLALIVVLLTIGSLPPSAGGAMELKMAVAGMADMDMPDCDGCDDLSVTCGSSCASAPMALAAFPDSGPMHAACAENYTVTHTWLVGIARPPDTTPPRSSWI